MLDYRDYLPEVPDHERDMFLALAAGTDKVCEAQLDYEYLELCRELAASLVFRSKFAFKGRTESWVSGILHVVGWVNFLQDPTQPHHMTSTQLAKYCGVSKQNMMDKSRKIREFLDIIPMDPDWSREEITLGNLVVWMFEVDGVVMDLRQAPRTIQEAAFAQGLIPFLPADHQVEEDVVDISPPDTKSGKSRAAPPIEHDLPFFDIPDAFPPEDKEG